MGIHNCLQWSIYGGRVQENTTESTGSGKINIAQDDTINDVQVKAQVSTKDNRHRILYHSTRKYTG